MSACGQGDLSARPPPLPLLLSLRASGQPDQLFGLDLTLFSFRFMTGFSVQPPNRRRRAHGRYRSRWPNAGDGIFLNGWLLLSAGVDRLIPKGSLIG